LLTKVGNAADEGQQYAKLDFWAVFLDIN